VQDSNTDKVDHTLVQDSSAEDTNHQINAAQPTKSPLKSPQKSPIIGDTSDSDLSVLLDEPPKRKRKPKSKPSESSSKCAKTSKPTPNPTTTKLNSKPKSNAPTSSPQEEDIKRLQSWLLKCGIRKLWHKELAGFSAAREKIAHLKGLLKEAGMGGRFSEDKARQIREERELKADLEDIVARERKWGQEDGEGGSDPGRWGGWGWEAEEEIGEGLEGVGGV